MFGLDDRLAHLTAGGGGLAIALVVAVLLGLRHATDPDHLTAVSTLALGDGRHGAGRAGRLGAAWGLGHAVTLVLFGLPIVLFRHALPVAVERASEAAVGVIVVALAARLYLRWRHGYLHVHEHEHDGVRHAHLHVHEHARAHEHPARHAHRHGLGRSPAAAFGIGLVHGLGGSAGVALLLVAAMPGRAHAAIALGLFAAATAVSMTLISTAFGRLITHDRVAPYLNRAIPAMALFSLAFGVWYGAAAVA